MVNAEVLGSIIGMIKGTYYCYMVTNKVIVCVILGKKGLADIPT